MSPERMNPDGTDQGLLFWERQSAADQPVAVLAGVFAVIVAGLAAPGWCVVLVACVFFATLWGLRLDTRVTETAVEIHYRPFLRRRWTAAEIATHGAVTYRPMREWGGWGVRMGWGRRAYTMAGDQGVRLDLARGVWVLIGSRAPHLLESAIDTMKGRSGPR